MNENKTSRTHLEQQTTAALDEMLRAELKEPRPDGDTVRMLLSVLRQREADAVTDVTAQERVLAEKLCRQLAPGSGRKACRVLKAASVVLVVGLLFFLMPQNARAETFFERLTGWTDDLFSFFSSGAENNGKPEFEFRTDNAGLQQVHDTLADLGVTDPVVPMWLPEGYALTKIITDETPAKNGVQAAFTLENQVMILKVDVYENGMSREFHKDDTDVEMYEINGIVHYIMRNNDLWAVAWAKDSVECFLTIDCQEDTLKEILGSIYRYGG